jgi:hypothetical protein
LQLAFENKADLRTWKEALDVRLTDVARSGRGAADAEDVWSGWEQSTRPRGAAALELMLLRRKDCQFVEESCIDADRCRAPLRIVIDQLSGHQNKPNGLLFVTVKAFYAGKLIIPELQTAPSATGSWMHRLEVSPTLSSLPCETVLMFSLYETAPSDTGKLRKLFMGEEGVTTCLAHGHLTLTDPCGFLRTGRQQIGLWPGEGSPVHFSFGMPGGSPPVLHVLLPSPPLPVAYSSFPSQFLVSGVPFVPQPGSVDVLAPIDPACPNPLAAVPKQSLEEAWSHRYDVSAKCFYAA